MSFFNRRLYKQKPQIWGPVSAVQSSIFANAERAGIDPKNVINVIPFWENAGSEIHSYGQFQEKATIDGHSWHSGGLRMGGATTDTGYAFGFSDKISFYADGANKPAFFTLLKTHSLLKISNGILTFLDNILGRRYSNRFNANWNYSTPYITNSPLIDGYSVAKSNAATISSEQLAKWQSMFGMVTACNLVEDSHADYWFDGALYYIDTSVNIYNLPANPNYPLTIFNDSHAYVTYDLYVMIHQNLTYSQITYAHDNPYFLLHRIAPVFYSLPTGTGGTAYQQSLSGSFGFSGAYARQATFNRTVNGTI
jgi:hypothetical protein